MSTVHMCVDLGVRVSTEACDMCEVYMGGVGRLKRVTSVSVSQKLLYNETLMKK